MSGPEEVEASGATDEWSLGEPINSSITSISVPLPLGLWFGADPLPIVTQATLSDIGLASACCSGLTRVRFHGNHYRYDAKE